MIDDLLLEAVENSVEAGALSIEVSARLEDGLWTVRVSDDGTWEPGIEPFSGKSSKGEGRGQGLRRVQNASVSCSLETGQATVLVFSIPDDHSLDDLFSAALPLLLWPCRIRLSFIREDKETVLDTEDLLEREAFPFDASGIARFKALVRGSKE